MSSRNILNIAILAVVLILAVVAFYPSIQKPTEAPVIRLFDMPKSAITHLTIQGRNQTPQRFTKLDPQGSMEKWYMEEPIHAKASEPRLNTLLDIVEQPSRSQYQVETANLAKYGLDSPIATLTFNEHAIAIGNNDPIHQRRYVLVDGKVHLIDDNFSHLLNENIGHLIDHDLLPVDSVIEKITLPDFELIKMDTSWQLTPPRNGSVSQDVLQTFIDEWRYSQALDVTIMVEPYTNRTAPAIRIKLQGQDTPILFYVEHTEQGTVFIRPEFKMRFHLTKDTAQRLLQLPDIEPPA